MWGRVGSAEQRLRPCFFNQIFINSHRMKLLINTAAAIILATAGLLTCCSGCAADTSGDTFRPEVPEIPEVPETPDEPGREVVETLGIKDLMLLYAGGKHRRFYWNDLHLEPYVSKESEDGKTHDWLFDGYLFLEIYTGYESSDKMFASGYNRLPATKNDWIDLLDYYFEPNNCVCALDKAVAKVKDKTTGPFEKRKVVISLPEPIPNQSNWGEIDGLRLNFRNEAHRVRAVEWYVDLILEYFEKAKLENVNLSGFYWLAERDKETQGIVKQVADCIHKKGYKFYWIPYFKAEGYEKWAEYGFDEAFLQPNHFFNDWVADSRIDEACQLARRNGLSLEMEFDDRMVQNESWGVRFYAYVNSFEDNNVFRDNNVAYYQGDSAWYSLWASELDASRRRYERFAKIIAERQKSKTIFSDDK